MPGSGRPCSFNSGWQPTFSTAWWRSRAAPRHRWASFTTKSPDRVSDTAILVGAGYAVGGEPVLGFAAACVALFTAYVRAMGKVAGGAQEYCGPMAKQQRMFLITVLSLYLAPTPHDWHFVLAERPSWGLPAGVLIVIIVGGLLTAVRRLGRVAKKLRASVLQ